MAYVPNDLHMYTAAFVGASAGMAASGRILTDTTLSDYTPYQGVADAWAQAFDTAWSSHGTGNELDVESAWMLSYSVWSERNPTTGAPYNVAATWTSQCLALVQLILAAEAQFALEGITPSAWGGGGGSTFPAPTAIGQTPIAIGVGPVGPGTVTWDLPGGLVINSFTGFAGTVEVGSSVTNPTVTASYNETPVSASISWTNPTGGPSALTTPFTSKVVPATFTDTVIGHTSVVTLTAVGATVTRTATQTRTYAGSIAFGSVTAPAHGQALYNTLRADGFQLHTNNSGTYAFASGAGADQCFAIPAGFGTPTVKDGNGFIYVPVLLGTDTITENGTSQSFNFFTVGNTGSTVNFTLS